MKRTNNKSVQTNTNLCCINRLAFSVVCLPERKVSLFGYPVKIMTFKTQQARAPLLVSVVPNLTRLAVYHTTTYALNKPIVSK